MDSSEITNNTAWGNGWGTTDTVRGGIVLRCKKSDYNHIEYNNASNNVGWYGIWVRGNYNNITNNTANDCNTGIKLDVGDGADYNEVSYNTACGNTIADIWTCDGNPPPGIGCCGNYGIDNTCDVCINCGGCNAIYCNFSCQPIFPCDVNGNKITEPFWPEDKVYVCGVNLTEGTEYKLWIQEHPVTEGDGLVTDEDPSECEATCDGGEKQEKVTVVADGTFGGPVAVWDIGPDSYAKRSLYHDWDVVADNQAGTVGTYNTADDEKCEFDVELPQVKNLSINTNRTLADGTLVGISTIELTWEGRACEYHVYICHGFPCDWADSWPCYPGQNVSGTSWIDTNCDLPYSDPIYTTPKQRYYKVVNAGEEATELTQWGEVVGKYDARVHCERTLLSVPCATKKPEINEVLKYSLWPGTRLTGGNNAISADNVERQPDDTCPAEKAWLVDVGNPQYDGKWYTGSSPSTLTLPSDRGFKIYVKSGHTMPTNVTLRLFYEG